MKNHKYAEIKISKNMKFRYFPECGHAVIYSDNDEELDCAQIGDCEYIEVSVYEEIEDEKR